MKEAYYFLHDYHARNDPKILRLRGRFGHEGYSVFWMLIESMAQERDGYLPRVLLEGLSLEYGSAIAQLTAIVDYCISIKLLKENRIGIYSSRLLTYKKFRSERSESGKKGASKRWNKNGSAIGSAIAQPMLRKGKDIYVNIYVDLFNKLTDGKYIITTGREQKLNARLKKYTMAQLQTALENIVKSKWHMGENDRGWKIDPDFLIRNDEQIDKWVNYKPGKEKSTGDFDRILKQMNL